MALPTLGLMRTCPGWGGQEAGELRGLFDAASSLEQTALRTSTAHPAPPRTHRRGLGVSEAGGVAAVQQHHAGEAGGARGVNHGQRLRGMGEGGGREGGGQVVR